MKRWPPFGTSDGTPWTNGNPAIGQRGSVIDARAIDHAQAEIVNAITRLGLTPDANNLEQLGLAIQNAIDAATGGGPADGYVTVESARARLPIYPAVLAANSRLTVTSPVSGTIVVAPTGTIRHRGVFDVALADIAEPARTFTMLPSRVAHLRWTAAGGLQRFYLDDPVYNPSSLPEADASFDTGYDSALLARIVTDASANCTITTLSNAHKLVYRDASSGAAEVITTGSGNDGARYIAVFIHNWSGIADMQFAGGWAGNPGAQTLHGRANVITRTHDRYRTIVEVVSDFDAPLVSGQPLGYAEVQLMRM
ncbi:hypothetical protein V6L76_17260 [Pannonibacter sp. Pt2]|uniref:Uncharacterized protein n=1 Tax=Pannonibacter anstelovis TaxID=3121537 RepID=A0ABU7ZS12_9HYPH